MSPLRLPLLVALLLGLLVSPGAVIAGELGDLKPTERLELLGGRLSLEMPNGAVNTARQASIMAAAESEEDETRLMLDAGDERLVVMTYELFATVPSDFEAAATTFAKDGGLEVEALALDGGLKGFLLTPTSLETEREANLVRALLVGHTDDTVQYIAFYVNPEGATDLPGVATLAEAIAATVQVGSRTLETEARSVSLEGGKLAFEIPADAVFTTQEGPDFSVYVVRWLAPLGAEAASLGIYVGGHPSHQYAQQGIGDDAVATESGKLLGVAVEWKVWTTPGGREMAEALLPFPGDDYLQLHIFASGPDAASRDRAKAAASTLGTP